VFTFDVEALANIGSEECYRVRIDEVSVDGKPMGVPVDFWRIYVRQDDFTLKKLERLAAGTEAIEGSRDFESGPVDATDWVGFLPLAFPDFSGAHSSQEPIVRESSDGTVQFRSSEGCRQSEKIMRLSTDGGERSALQITLERTGDDGLPRRTTQTWIKGKPWWVEAAHERDGHQWCSATLVEE
jgi:hypothetical protein